MQDQDQLTITDVRLRSDATRCPDCGGKSGVYTTRRNIRYRYCLDCARKWRTQEVHQAHIDQAIEMVDAALQLEEELREHGDGG